jgi:hexokinase
MKENIFNLTAKQLQEIAEVLKDKVEEGLSKDNQEVQCIPTFITPKAGAEGKVLVLDLGGTNYRVASVECSDGKAVIRPEDGWKKDLSVMKTPGFTEEKLYAEQADPIKEINIDNVPVGYCFSYPAESMPDGDGKLIRWTKGLNIPEMIGKPVGRPLVDYLNKVTGKNFTKANVINDTVASLFAGLTRNDYDAYIGLIVGTGTNMATFIDAGKITKLRSMGINGLLPVNLESGNFDPPHLTSIDAIVDASSGSFGSQRFEKAVSGMYLGEILKAVFPFDEFEKKFDAQKLTCIMGYPDIHKEKYVRVARWIYERSAKLVAASLAGLILIMVSGKPEIKRIRLVAEGSLFWSDDRKGVNYKDIVIVELHNLLKNFGLKDIKVDIHNMENANLIGSAIAALS